MKVHFFTIALLLFMLPLAGCNGDAEAPANGEEEVVNGEYDVQIDDFEFIREEDGSRYFTGLFRNTGDIDIDNALVEVSFLDEQNRRVSTMEFQVQDVPAGEEKRFREVIDRDEEYHSARVRGVTPL